MSGFLNLCITIKFVVQVLVNTNFSANWSVPRASKNDRIGELL